MKRQIVIAVFAIFTISNLYAQFPLENYLSQSLEKFDNKRIVSMTDLTKTTKVDTLNKIPIKIELFVTKEASTMKQVLTSGSKKTELIKKLFDLLNEAIIKKVGKAQNDEENYGIRNCFWRAVDGTVYTLSKTGDMTMLTMLKMQ